MPLNVRLTTRTNSPLLAMAIGALTIVAFLTAHHQPATAQQDDRSYRLATGNATSHSYKIGIGIASLVKIHVMPKTGVDIEAFATSGMLESFLLLQEDKAQLALLSGDWGDLVTSEANAAFNFQLNAVATLWREDGNTAQLIARQDVAPETVYEITKAVFERLDFLRNLDAVIGKTSLDTALDGVTMPLHEGARRYYEEKAVPVPPPAVVARTEEARPAERIAGASIEQAASVSANRAEAAADTQSVLVPADRSFEPVDEARTFTIYFGLDQAGIDDEGQAVLDQVKRFVDSLQDASIWVAGYTDTAGDADYNLQLAQKRAEAVQEALQSRQIDSRDMDVTALGERSPWIVTADQTFEARNRRVEILIEPFRNPFAPRETSDAANDNDGATGNKRAGPVF